MRTPRLSTPLSSTTEIGGGRCRRSSVHRRIADFLAMDSDADEEEQEKGNLNLEKRMPPATLPPDEDSNSEDLMEVTLELEEDGIIVRNVTPSSTGGVGGGGDAMGSMTRCSSTAARIRRKFAWLKTPSPRRSGELTSTAMMTARDQRRIQARLERTRSGADGALEGLRFISRTTGCVKSPEEMWLVVEQRFHLLARDEFLSREDFGECIGMVETKEFAKGVFDALTRRRKQNLQRISKEELYDFWIQISDQSFDARLQIFFDMVDTNVDGRITREEVQELIVLSASANKLSKLKEQAEEYASLIMEELDPENLGYIEIWQLEALLLQRDRYMNNSRPLSTTASRMIGNPRGIIRMIGCSLKCVALENWQRLWVVVLWVVAMVGLFVWKFFQYRRHSAFQVMGYCLPAAKGAAETLKLNMALILLPVCRNMITWLRSTAARLVVPFDDNINFHKMIAVAIVCGVFVHAGNHLVCDFPRTINASPSTYAHVAQDLGSKKPTYASLLSGVEGITGIGMVLLMGIAFTLATSGFRKNGVRLPYPLNRLTGFNAFWYSHHLLAFVYVLLILHGYFVYLVHKWYKKTTWMYISVPLLLYLGERTLRTFRSESYTVKILKVSVLPGNVLAVVMSKPHAFKYRSGQYIFLQCPAISPFEWHPFSITSAPGDDHISVHIRTVGDWTRELRSVFTEVNNSQSVVGRAKFSDSGVVYQKSLPRLLVDGPYGAPAQNYTNYDVLLLVGLGIGATPFISILRDLLNNIRMAEEQTDSNTDISRLEDSANSFGSTSNSSTKKRNQRTSNAHFYWVTREPNSFEWFKGVMNEVAEMDHKGVFEMHNYLTSVYEEGDARTTLLTMVQALNHAKRGFDIVSGTRVRTHFARPNWNDVFERIASKHPGKTVGVFYCGMPVLAKELKRLSYELSQRTTTRFHFHKEYF